jgi:hypothetical protein
MELKKQEQALTDLKHSKISSDLEVLKSSLRLAMLKVGIRAANIPVDEEKMVLLDFVHRNYGSYTPAMIDEAFEMALTGKLDVDPSCYENFSCEYIGRILSAYERHLKSTGKVKSSHDLERQYIGSDRQLEAPAMSPEEKIVASYGVWKLLGKIEFIMPGTYEALLDNKSISVTDDDKKRYLNMAAQKGKELLKTNPNFFKGLDKWHWVRNYAKKLVVHDHFCSKEQSESPNED